MKKIIIIIGLVIVSCCSYAYFQYNKPTKNILEEDVHFTMTARELNTSFNSAPKASNAYLDKVFMVSGKVTLVEQSTESTILILDDSVKCEINNTNDTTTILVGSMQKIKGIFSGYDEMFNEITLSKCHILN